MAAGHHTISWDGRDDQRRPVASGIYLLRITAGDFVRTRKAALLR